ncbi:hypothetical protein V6N12_057700 [Hibiscus sabdariffa]|uniref:S-acyltransferase n=1 Tax=Hibiscus sabdariffa TaxID=183260 RepID=A0ABR2C606_9ROSI
MTSPGIMNAVAFTGVAVMCVLNYALAIIMDPGRVPSTFLPDIEDSSVTVHEIKRKGGDLRYCQKCSHFKPPRAHHCRVCKICVLRMDHHCIWIHNCVGHANYKVFFVFVVYAAIACIYSLVLLVGSLTNDSQSDEQQSADSFRIIYIISGLLLVPLSMALSVLLGWHIYLILQNKTTIEYHEGVRATGLEEKVGNACKHPYWVQGYSVGYAPHQSTLAMASAFKQPMMAYQLYQHQHEVPITCGNKRFFNARGIDECLRLVCI